MLPPDRHKRTINDAMICYGACKEALQCHACMISEKAVIHIVHAQLRPWGTPASNGGPAASLPECRIHHRHVVACDDNAATCPRTLTTQLCWPPTVHRCIRQVIIIAGVNEGLALPPSDIPFVLREQNGLTHPLRLTAVVLSCTLGSRLGDWCHHLDCMLAAGTAKVELAQLQHCLALVRLAHSAHPAL